MLAWVVCLHGWRAIVGSVGGVLTWVAWVACQRGLRANVGYLVGVIAWVTCQRG